MQSNKQIVNSARRTYNQLGLNDRIITNTKLHTLRSILYRAGCNHSEVRVIMKWRRDAQSRLHPETCKRKQKELENEVRMLETEKRELCREVRGLQLEISILADALRDSQRLEHHS